MAILRTLQFEVQTSLIIACLPVSLVYNGILLMEIWNGLCLKKKLENAYLRKHCKSFKCWIEYAKVKNQRHVYIVKKIIELLQYCSAVTFHPFPGSALCVPFLINLFTNGKFLFFIVSNNLVIIYIVNNFNNIILLFLNSKLVYYIYDMYPIVYLTL
jgi:hypothetical protein